jgi:DNA modification methylase
LSVTLASPSAEAEPNPAPSPPKLRAADAALPVPPEAFFAVHQWDARRLEMLLARHSSPARPLLTTTITSPPYGALKDYGHKDQIGFGQREDEYLVDMRRVFRTLSAHTKADGSMWVIADTLRPRHSGDGVWPMQLLPFQLANEATSEGWILRDVIIWVKDKTLPWSSRGRMRNAFEYVLFFVKSSGFKYRVDRLREPDDLEQWWVRYPERYNPQGKAPSNVWAVPIPVQGSWANTAVKHACPLPPDLVERALLLSTDEGDVVLDPFAGSGVVVAEARRLARRGLGAELVQSHVDAFESTVLPEITERRGLDALQGLRSRSEELRQTILDLRSVKYPKVLAVKLRELDPTLPRPYALYSFRRKQRNRPDKVALEVVVVLKDSDLERCDDFLEALGRVARRAPASKFGIVPRFRVVGRSGAARLHRGRRLFAYVSGRTHRASGVCTSANVDEWAIAPSRHNVPLIVSNVFVDESPRRLRAAEAGRSG